MRERARAPLAASIEYWMLIEDFAAKLPICSISRAGRARQLPGSTRTRTRKVKFRSVAAPDGSAERILFASAAAYHSSVTPSYVSTIHRKKGRLPCPWERQTSRPSG
jgi:hypothetical protein